MTLFLYFVVVCSIFLNSEMETGDAAAVAPTTATNTDACSLLKSCLNASDANFADCDKILDQYQPPCWSDMKSLVVQLRTGHSAETAQLSSCLATNTDANDNALPPKMTKQCQSMLASYQHIASQEGWGARKKRDTSKDWTVFYKCINNAQRHHSICQQLSGCCPREQKCTWQNALQPAHASALQLKIKLYGVRQNCLVTLDGDSGTQYDDWNILGGQPVWTDD